MRFGVVQKQYSSLLLLRLVPIAAQVLLLGVLLSSVGPFHTGVIAFFIAGVAVFRGLASFGLDMETIRVSSRSLSDEGYLSRELFWHIIVRATFTSAVASVLLALLGIFVPSPSNSIWAISMCGFFGTMVGVLVSYLRPSKSLLKSQAFDTIGTSLMPTIAVSVFVITVGYNFLFVVFCYSICSLATCVVLFSMALRQSQSLSSFESLDRRTWALNGISQSLTALNSRFPTLVTGILFTPVMVTYIDIGSKMQLIGGTVAWLFGVLQSPGYAKDEKFLSSSSLKWIARSTFWSSGVLLIAGIFVLILSSQISVFLKLDQELFQTSIAWFLVMAIIESPSISAGYGLVMTKNAGVVTFSVITQMLVASFGLLLANGNLLQIGVWLSIGALARLAVVAYCMRKNIRNARYKR